MVTWNECDGWSVLLIEKDNERMWYLFGCRLVGTEFENDGLRRWIGIFDG